MRNFFRRYIIIQMAVRFILLLILVFAISSSSVAQVIHPSVADLKQQFQSPSGNAKSMVFWYWLQGAVTRRGITADLEAMKEAGLGGAYLMPIKGPANPPVINPPVVQLTPEWWQMVTFAINESKRLNLQLAIHVSDGFALAGGPWITPEMSMQKLVWTERKVEGGKQFSDTLQTPETIEGYYKDIVVFAYPSPEGAGISTNTVVPKVTTSKAGIDAQSLANPLNTVNFGSDDSCWIQYAFDQPFTCRSIIIRSRTNYQSNRLIIETSDDGKNYTFLRRLEPPRHGWQDWDAPYTHVIPATTARFFRFVYTKAGSEPGAEDLDAAKWKPTLKIASIELSGEPRISQYEGKNGEVWRISKRTTSEEIPANLCVPLKSIIDITGHLDSKGHLNWKTPAGKWTVLRIGHTSTGHRNDTGGGGKGLECDKFDPRVIKLQFDNWFGKFFEKAGPGPASEVIKIFHIDSWECGSQNWSIVFREEFKKRRGYDLYPYLPVMAGIPVESVDASEKFLLDVRETISELLHDNFYVTLARLAHGKHCSFTAESVAPTMVSDAMLHYQAVDVPMGEFWLRSPTHDKPNDMMDAIAGAHIYGKPIIQAEAFTELRTMWDEHPGMLKTLQDQNYALGINRLVYHVFMHDPFMDRKPGITLDGIGLFFQRNQTWWKPGKAWVQYAQRCQTLLQVGRPVADIAVFTGEDIPRRSILPNRLVPALPGIFGKEVVEREAKRLANTGQPLRTLPVGVTHSANMADPEDWIDPLNGYAYDSYNRDVLLNLSTVKKGNLELPGGASYKLLVLPGTLAMSPNANLMTTEVLTKLQKLVEQGVTLLLTGKPIHLPGIKETTANNNLSEQAINTLWNDKPISRLSGSTGGILQVGKGRVLTGPFKGSLEDIGMQPDFIAKDSADQKAIGIAWTHRQAPGLDIYFVSNQHDQTRTINLSLRIDGRIPELWNPVTGETSLAKNWRFEKGRTILPVRLAENESVFIVLKEVTTRQSGEGRNNWIEPKPLQQIKGAWVVYFDEKMGGPATPKVFNELTDWSKHADSAIRYYSGTATYRKQFDWNETSVSDSKIWLNIGKVCNIAELTVNGIRCGVTWTAPFRVDITHAIRKGKNELSIEVTNTWANRIMGDHRLPEDKRITNTNAPYRLEGKELLQAGLLGPVVIER